MVDKFSGVTDQKQAGTVTDPGRVSPAGPAGLPTPGGAPKPVAPAPDIARAGQALRNLGGLNKAVVAPLQFRAVAARDSLPTDLQTACDKLRGLSEGEFAILKREAGSLRGDLLFPLARRGLNVLLNGAGK